MFNFSLASIAIVAFVLCPCALCGTSVETALHIYWPFIVKQNTNYIVISSQKYFSKRIRCHQRTPPTAPRKLFDGEKKGKVKHTGHAVWYEVSPDSRRIQSTTGYLYTHFIIYITFRQVTAEQYFAIKWTAADENMRKINSKLRRTAPMSHKFNG